MPTPVIDPRPQVIFLAFAEQDQVGAIERGRIEVGIGHMIGSTGSRINLLRTTLELTIREHHEPHVRVDDVAVVDRDCLFDGSWIGRVGMVGDIRAVNHVDHPRGLSVAGRRTGVIAHHRDSSFAPQIALKDIMIVWNAERGAILHHRSEGPTEHVELSQVVQDRRLRFVPNHPKSAMILIQLIP